MSQRNFLPVVIVGGIIPQILRYKGYTFKFSMLPEEVLAFGDVYYYMKKVSLANIDYWFHEIKVLK